MAIFKSHVGPYPAKSYGNSMPTFVNNINATAKIICDEIVTNGGDTFVTKTYVDSILGLDNNMYFPLEKMKEAKEYEKRKREAAENKAAAEKEAALKALECFQPDVFKPFVNVLTSKLSEDDCRALCVLLFDVLSKDNKQITLSPSIETAILTFMINNQ